MLYLDLKMTAQKIYFKSLTVKLISNV